MSGQIFKIRNVRQNNKRRIRLLKQEKKHTRTCVRPEKPHSNNPSRMSFTTGQQGPSEF